MILGRVLNALWAQAKANKEYRQRHQTCSPAASVVSFLSLLSLYAVYAVYAVSLTQLRTHLGTRDRYPLNPLKVQYRIAILRYK